VSQNNGKLIDVLMLAKNDWANTGYRFWRCARSLGLNTIMFKGERHAFRYENQAPLHPSLTGLPVDLYPVTVMAPYLEFLLAQARVVHFLASTFILTPGWKWSPETKVVVQHGGSTYRLAPDRSNAIFNPICDATIIQCPDLLELGAKNETLIYYPVDTDALQPQFEPRYLGKILVGHFPSDPSVKGTAEILKIVGKLEADPTVSTRFGYQGIRNVGGTAHWVPWEEQLQRVGACDVIIETVNPSIAGRKFGEWGNTALEAAAMGKIVVTNSLSVDVYKREYGGNPALHIANTPEALESCLRDLMAMPDEEIAQRKHHARDWAVKNHSMEATAKRLWERVYRPLMEG